MMRTLRAMWIRMRGLFGSAVRDAEFDAELASHLQMHIDDNLRSGMSPEKARREAVIRLGGVEQTKQAYRDRRTIPFVEALLQDIRYGLRAMARNPAFTAVAVMTLALGIGASTTVFSWIDEVLLRPLQGVAEPERLVTLESVTANGEQVPNSYPDYQDFRDHLKLFDGIAVTRPAAFSVGQEDHAERVWGELVSGNFFAVLGVKPAVGRVFLPEEYGDKPGSFPVAVISDRYWRTRYHADPTITGRTIRINQHELTIVGVAAPGFRGSMPATAFDLWVPYMQQPVLNGVNERMLRNRQNRNMLGIARLKRGVSIEQGQHELAALATYMSVANADVSEGMSATLLPLSKSPHGPQALLAAPLKVLMGICFLVLLIVCANVANLLLARAATRDKEFSTRLALGAGRGRLVRQVLTESLLLALAGGFLGTVLAWWMRQSLKYLLPPGQMSLGPDLRWNGHALLFTVALCVLTALLAGLAPMFHVGRMNLSGDDLAGHLNEGGRGGKSGVHSQRLRSIFVVSEVALALVALIGAGLFARGFAATAKLNPGFDPERVLVSQFYLSTSGYGLEQREEFCRRLQQKLEATPGVVNAAYSDGIPLGFEPSWWEDLRIEGYTPAPGENMKIFRNVISPGYLGVMRISLVDGRNFTEHDDDKSQPVMIVNQEFVRRFFGGRIPIGRKIHGWGDWFTVVGVARDSKYHYLGESPLPYAYYPFRQVYRADMQLAFYLRTKGNPETTVSVMREKVKEIDPNVTVFDAAPLKDVIGASLYPQKVAATLLTVMGGLAVLLAAVGMYSVMAYSVVQRTHEIGIRIALGATPKDVLGLVVRQGLRLAAAGLVLGSGIALLASRSLATISFTGSSMGGQAKLLPTSATDPLIYLGAAAFLCAVAAAAAYVPARRAANVEPMVALRAE